MAAGSGGVYSRYLKSCEKRKLEPISSVLEACKVGSGALSLAGTCLSVDQCSVLAKTLQHGHPFTELDCSDCLMGNEGLNKLVEFLRDDVHITTVILKGNSIKSNGGALTVADLLRRNASIQILSLEWNSLGLYESDMKILCEGLSMNASLCVLDIRSNHIDHVGASHIADMLLINSSLQELDLRWNNVGVLGGRKLLSALRSNRTLVKLRLEGNSVPVDITEAINTSLSLRLSHHVCEAQHHIQTLQLSAQLNQLHTDSEHKVMEVLDTLDTERKAFMETTQLSQCEIADLKCHLEERDTTIARLEAKLLDVQGALRESLVKSEELCNDLEEVRSQASSEDIAKQSRIGELEKDLTAIEEKKKKELTEAIARERTANTKVHSLELEVQILHGKLAAAGRDTSTMRESLVSRVAQLEGALSESEGKFKDQLATQRQAHQLELLSCVEESRGREGTTVKRAEESEHNAARLEQELRRLRAQSGEDKGKAMEEAERLQQALKLQTMKCSHLEDQIEELRGSHRSKLENLNSKLSHQQSERERLEHDFSKTQKKLKSLQQEYESERGDWEKAKLSHKRMVKEQGEEKDILSREIKQLKKTLEEERQRIVDMEGKREADIKALRTEKAGLKHKLEQQKSIIQRFQVDEQQRMTQLKAALNSYFTTPLIESDTL